MRATAASRCQPLLALLIALAPTARGSGQNAIDLDPPAERDFILDTAGLIGADDAATIRQTCDDLLRDRATPIIVVTIRRMTDHAAFPGPRIETFAHLLFDQWGIGHAELGDEPWNTGILLLVSKDDRKARIELGAGWGREKDATCRRIMDEQIVRRFKRGDYSGGIVAGVRSLDRMVRGRALPAKPVSRGLIITFVIGVLLIAFTVVSLVRRGDEGWAWVFWGVVMGTVVFIVRNAGSSSGSSSGGGFSGGSFGGGFSGGGGASGSW
ncbi:MAG: TPM domain-containing protein [Planctomycetota bacterium]|jgi:uncharacterized protein